MKQFEVTITETLIKKVIVSAETVEEVENIADSMNFNGEIDWSSDVAEDGDTVAEKFNGVDEVVYWKPIKPPSKV